MISKKLYRYSIDRFNGRFVHGWCFHRLHKNRRLTISIIGDGVVIGTAETMEYRKDLKKEKVHPTGLCGFDFSFPPDFIPGRYRLLEIYVEGVSKPLFSISGEDVERLTPDPAQKICFMHIPKTAGSSFNAFLRCCYPKAEYLSHLERLEDEGLIVEHPQVSCISGHLPFYKLKSLVERDQRTLYSIVREPYHHLHSHINYVKRVATDQEDQLYYQYKHNETIKSLGAKLCQIDFQNEVDIRTFVNNLFGFELDFFDNIQTRYFLDYRPDKVGSSDLEQAKTNIDNFKLVGLTEHYDQFINQFCRDLSLPLQANLQRANISETYKLFDTEHISIDNPLQDLVGYDHQLYQYISDTSRRIPDCTSGD